MNPKMNKKTLKKDCRLKRLTFRMNIRMKYSRMNLSLLLLLLLVSINTSYSIPIENESTSLASSISLKEESQSILSPANSFMHYNPDRTWFQFATFRNPTIASDLENEKLDVWVDVEERLEENDRISDLAVNDVDRHVNSDEESDHDSVHDSESVRDGNEVGDDEDSVIQSIQR